MTKQPTTLATLFAEHGGKVSDKWSFYITEYNRLFQAYRDHPVRLLEIGIQNGGSLEIWSKFFTHAIKLIGCDINSDCAQLQFDDPRIAVVVGDANTDETQQQLLKLSPDFDLIIDDGSHHSGDIVRSFARYFTHLNDGGLYIAEDLHCSYWQDFEGGLFQPYSSIAFFKQLADTINHEHWGIDKTRTELLRSFNQQYNTRFDEVSLAHIHSIEFINSMCVVRKAIPADNVLGQRFIAGSHALVCDDVLQLNGSSCTHPNQSANKWTAREMPIEEELTVRIQEITNLNQAMTERDGKATDLIRAVLTQDQNVFHKSFDAEWYGKKYPDVDMASVDLYQHYVNYGILEGRIPAADIANFIRNGLLDHLKNLNAQHNQAKLQIETQLLQLVEREKEYSEREQSLSQQLQAIHQELHRLEQARTQREQEFITQLLAIQQQANAEKAELSQQHQAHLQEIQRQHAEHEWLTAERIHTLNQELHRLQADKATREQVHAEITDSLRNELASLLRMQAQREQEIAAQLLSIQLQANTEKTELNHQYQAHLQVMQHQHAESEQAHLAQLTFVRQQLDTQLLALAAREKEFFKEIQTTRQTHEQQKNDLSCQHTEREKALNTQLLAKQAELSQLSQRGLETQQTYMQSVNHLKQQLQTMRTSYTWRWTAPLRSFAQLFIKSDASFQEDLHDNNDRVSPSLMQDGTVINPLQSSPQVDIHEQDTMTNLAPTSVLNMSANRTPRIAQSVSELLSYYDEEFVHYAYQTLLGRAPDAEGLRYYLARVRSGVSKVEILTQLRLGTEGKSLQVKIAGLDEAIKRHKLLKIPLLGALLRLTGIKQVEDSLQRKLNAIEKTLHLIETNSQTILFEIENKFQQIDKRLNQHPVAINQSSIQTKPLKSIEHYPGITIADQIDTTVINQFDAEWYLEQYPDVARIGMDPFEHYVKFGRAEGRCPTYILLYQKWIHDFDTFTEERRTVMRARVEKFVHKPLVSVVLPVYNPNPVWLEQAIKSVFKQIYPNWELCISDDTSTDPAIHQLLKYYSQLDSRIKIVFRESKGHISVASNSALALVQGEWIALLDQHDILAEHAMFWVVEAINQHSDTRLIYSDEDKIDVMGARSLPYFKCDWNPDLFYSQNMISHLGVYHAALVREVGGFRAGLEGSQDYDLALRCVEYIAPEQIHHIPRVLYHCRVHAGSAALSAVAKPYAPITGERALNEHLERQGVNAKAESMGYGYRVRYALPDTLPLVSLIIPTRNGLKLLEQCVESILVKTTYPNYEILIVDNGSDDPSTLLYLKNLTSEQRIRVIRDDRPFNYSALNNAAVKLARGEIIGLINNDIEVISPDWLSEMVSYALQPKVGAVGAKLYYPDDTIQHAGVVLGMGGIAGHCHRKLPRGNPGYMGKAILIQSLSVVTAACLLIRKSVYESVNGLNETDLTVAFNDVDFCLRLGEAGYRNIWTPYAELYHHESATRGAEDTLEKQARFRQECAYMKQRWEDILQRDPSYSPNLSLDRPFSLAFPPRFINPPFQAEHVNQRDDKHSTLNNISEQKHYLFLTCRMKLGFGVDVVVSNVTTHLKQLGHHVTIGCLEKDDHYKTFDVRLIEANPVAINDFIEEADIDCVIAHTSPFFEVLPLLNPLIPIWAWEHGDPTPTLFPFDSAIRKEMQERKIKDVYPALTGVIAISDFIRTDIQWTSAQVIYNGCDNVPDFGSKGILDFDSEPFAKLKIGTLMRLGQGESHYKGNDMFLEIAKRCYAQNIPAQFYVMGRGTPEDAAYFQSIGIETYLNTPDAQKWDFLRKLDMFFSPSLWEGCNLPLLEAQASGTLGFAFDTGAHPEITPFITSSIDEAVALIRKMSTDRSLLLKHSLLSYRFVRTRFSWKESVVKFLQITKGNKW